MQRIELTEITLLLDRERQCQQCDRFFSRLETDDKGIRYLKRDLSFNFFQES
jgi:hypothetical protein